jgi:hypothetical protein
MPEPNEQPTPQQPLNPDLMGYPTVEALVAAKRASDAEGKRLFDENQKKDVLLSQMLVNGVGDNPRQSVPDRRPARPEDRLTEFGVPVDALREVIREQFAEAFRPISNGLQARGQLVASHPDYVQYETDVAQFINTDPELSASYPKMFEAAPVQAMEYAFLKFGESRRKALGGEPQAQTPGRADAGIPTSRSGDGRREPGQDAAIQDAFERFQKTGSPQDATAYAKARLKGVISDEFLQK